MTKTKRTPISQDIKLNIYTKEVIKKTEVESTIKNHFNEERLEIKEDLKRSNIFVLVMFGLGILTFAILVALYKKIEFLDLLFPQHTSYKHQKHLLSLVYNRMLEH